MPQRRSSKKKISSKQSRAMTTIAKRVLNKNSETKRSWLHFNETALTHVGVASFYDPIAISQGTAVNERVGNEIKLSGFHLRGAFNNNYEGVNYVRMMLFYYKDQADVTTASDFFEASGGSSLTSAASAGLNSIYYPVNKTKVQVMYNKVLKLAAASSDGTASTKFFNMFVKLHGRKVRFAGPATGADNVSPRLHLAFWISDAQDDFPSSQVEISAVGSTWYKDI